jgi:hypothetical protein
MSDFKFARTQALFTYRGWLDKKLLLRTMNGLSVRKVVSAIISHEETNFKCTRALIKWDKIFQTTKSDKFNIGRVSPTIKTLSGKNAFDEESEYVCETDPDPLIYGEANKNYSKAEEGSMDDEDKEYVQWFRGQKLNRLQREWYEKLKRQDGRQILWIYNKVGNTGKSHFGTWLQDKHDAFEMCGQWDRDVDQWNGSKWIFLDLTRADEDSIHYYKAIEKMKNGRARSGRYKGKSRRKKPPRIVVFSNFYPDENYLSEDRWDIYIVPENAYRYNSQQYFN